MMPKTQEQRNALISTAGRCNEELKAAMNQKPKPKFDAVSRSLLKKHFEKLKPRALHSLSSHGLLE